MTGLAGIDDKIDERESASLSATKSSFRLLKRNKLSFVYLFAQDYENSAMESQKLGYTKYKLLSRSLQGW